MSLWSRIKSWFNDDDKKQKARQTYGTKASESTASSYRKAVETKRKENAERKQTQADVTSKLRNGLTMAQSIDAKSGDKSAAYGRKKTVNGTQRVVNKIADKTIKNTAKATAPMPKESEKYKLERINKIENRPLSASSIAIEQNKLRRKDKWESSARKAVGDKDLQFEQKLGLNKDLRNAAFDYGNEEHPYATSFVKGALDSSTLGLSNVAINKLGDDELKNRFKQIEDDENASAVAKAQGLAKDAGNATSEGMLNGRKAMGALGGLVGGFVGYGGAVKTGVPEQIGRKIMGNSKVVDKAVKALSNSKFVQGMAERAGVGAAELSEAVAKNLAEDIGLHLTLENAQAIVSALDTADNTQGGLSEKTIAGLKSYIGEQATNTLMNVGMDVAPVAKIEAKNLGKAYKDAMTVDEKLNAISLFANENYARTIDYTKFKDPKDILKDSDAKSRLKKAGFFNDYKDGEEAEKELWKLWAEVNLNDETPVPQMTPEVARAINKESKNHISARMWFSSEQDNSYKDAYIDYITANPLARAAAWNTSWLDFKKVASDPSTYGQPKWLKRYKDISFSDYLNMPQKVFRGVDAENAELYRGGKGGVKVAAWTPDRSVAENFAVGADPNSMELWYENPIGVELPNPAGGNLKRYTYSNGAELYEQDVAPKDMILGRVGGSSSEKEQWSINPTFVDAEEGTLPPYKVVDKLPYMESNVKKVGDLMDVVPSADEINAANPYYYGNDTYDLDARFEKVSADPLREYASKFTNDKDLRIRGNDLIDSSGNVLLKDAKIGADAESYAIHASYADSAFSFEDALRFDPEEAEIYISSLRKNLTDDEIKMLDEMQYSGAKYADGREMYTPAEQSALATKELQANVDVLNHRLAKLYEDETADFADVEADSEFISDEINLLNEKIQYLSTGHTIEQLKREHMQGGFSNSSLTIDNAIKEAQEKNLAEAKEYAKQKQISEADAQRKYVVDEIEESFGEKFDDSALSKEDFVEVYDNWRKARDEYNGDYDDFDFYDDYAELFGENDVDGDLMQFFNEKLSNQNNVAEPSYVKISPPNAKTTLKKELAEPVHGDNIGSYLKTDDIMPGVSETRDVSQTIKEELDNTAPKGSPILDEIHAGVKKVDPKGKVAPDYEHNGVKVKTQKKYSNAAKAGDTNKAHNKKGFVTIVSATGQKGYEGDILKKIESGSIKIKRYGDAENYKAGAERVIKLFTTKKGSVSVKGIRDYIDGTLKLYASGEKALTSKQARDFVYDGLACVDIAIANKDATWSKDLYLSACEALGELASVSGLGLRQWQKIAMSSPLYRAEAVQRQILKIFNSSKGFIASPQNAKYLTGGKMNSAGFEEFVDANPRLKKALKAIEEVDNVSDIQKVASRALLEARKMIPLTQFDQINQWRYVAMLSSPKTHVKNIMSNIYTGVMGGISSSFASSIQDHLIKSGAVPEGYFKSTNGASATAFTQSHKGAIANYKAMSEVEKLEDMLFDAKADFEVAIGADNIASARKKVQSLEAELESAKKNVEKVRSENVPQKEEMKAAKDWWYSKGSAELIGEAEKYEAKYGSGLKGGKAVGKMAKLITGALHTSDSISIEARACENYCKTLEANHWKELKELADSGDKEAKESLENLEKIAASHASDRALTETYNNYNAFAKWANSTLQKTIYNNDAKKIAKLGGYMLNAAMPFLKVPANVASKTITYSPIGLVNGKIKLEKAIKKGDIAEINKATEDIGQGIVGSSIAFIGVGLGFIDPYGMKITTRLQDNDDADKLKKDAGYQDYSATIGKNNFTLEWLTPTSGSFFTGVEIGQKIRNLIDDVRNDNLDFDIASMINVPMEITSRLIEPTLQMTMFQGINDILEGVVESDNYSKTNINPVLKAVERISSNYAKSLYPALNKQISRAIAPYDYFISAETDLGYDALSLAASMPSVTIANNLTGKPLFGAKTNIHGQIKNERDGINRIGKGAEYLLSPANRNKITWDSVDDELLRLNKKTGTNNFFPKNFYSSKMTFGKNSDSAVSFKMSNKDKSDYNVAKGKAGKDAMSAALTSVIFNRYGKADDGKRTVPIDVISDKKKAELEKEFSGKGAKDVMSWVIKQPQYKNATEAEQEKIWRLVYGTGSGYGNDDTSTSVGAKRASELAIAKKKGMSEAEYDYKNEVSAKVQKALDPFIKNGVLTYEEVVDFQRAAGVTYYYTDENGESGGKTQTYYNKENMIKALVKKGFSYEKAEALYNAYKNSNAKSYDGSGSGSSRSGYSGHGYSHHRRSGSSVKGATNKTAKKVTGLKDSKSLASAKSSGSKSVGNKYQLERVKATPPNPKY